MPNLIYFPPIATTTMIYRMEIVLYVVCIVIKNNNPYNQENKTNTRTLSTDVFVSGKWLWLNKVGTKGKHT